MITIIDGEGVGAGKSFFVCREIAKKLAAGGTVYCSDTFKVRWEGMMELCGHNWNALIEVDQLHFFSEADAARMHEVTPPGSEGNTVLVVIDEAQGALNTRDTRNSAKVGMFNWLCQSRHDDNDVLFLTQDGDNIDVQIRRLATVNIQTENMETNYVPFVGFLSKNYFRIRYYNKSKTREIQPMEFIRKDKRVFGAYISKSMKGTHQRGGEVVIAKKLARARQPRGFTSYILMFCLVLAFACIGVGGYKVWKGRGILTGGKAKVNDTATETKPQKKETEKKPTYEVITEQFRGGDDQSFLRTVQDEYQTGEMSGKGFVRAIHGHTAKVNAPDGTTIYVVARDMPSEQPHRLIAPKIEPIFPKTIATVTPVPYQFPPDEFQPRGARK